jgi:hypothetical protein
MLTGFQVATGAYRAEYGELYCESCFEGGDVYCVPVSNYILDEWQSEVGADQGFCADADEPWENETECGCEPPLLCDGCSAELRAEWEDTYFHDAQKDEEDYPEGVKDDDA